MAHTPGLKGFSTKNKAKINKNYKGSNNSSNELSPSLSLSHVASSSSSPSADTSWSLTMSLESA